MKDMSHSLSLFFKDVHFIIDLKPDRDGDIDVFGDFEEGLGEGDRRDNVFLREGDIFFTFVTTFFALFTTFLTLFVIFLHLPVFGLRFFPVGQSLVHLIVSTFRTFPGGHFLIHRPVFGLFSFPEGHAISFFIIIFIKILL